MRFGFFRAPARVSARVRERLDEVDLFDGGWAAGDLRRGMFRRALHVLALRPAQIFEWLRFPQMQMISPPVFGGCSRGRERARCIDRPAVTTCTWSARRIGVPPSETHLPPPRCYSETTLVLHACKLGMMQAMRRHLLFADRKD